MSTAGVYRAIEVIRRDLMALANAVLEDDTISTNVKVNRNTLANSDLKRDIVTYWQAQVESGNDPVIGALFNHYVIYLEWDRPPKYGKRPPISVLKDWASKNGISTDASTLWVISNAIWRDGHKGRPIFATMDKFTDRLFDEDWSDDLFDALTDELDNFFNAA